MKYLLAIICPPLAVLICGKPFQAFINLLLCLLAFIPGIVHALFVVFSKEAKKRNDELVQAIRESRKNEHY